MNDSDISNGADRIAARLKDCFLLALPRLDPGRVASATIESVDGWDSVATLILVATVEEEFSLAIGFDQVPDLTSFAAFQTYLAGRLGASGA